MHQEQQQCHKYYIYNALKWLGRYCFQHQYDRCDISARIAMQLWILTVKDIHHHHHRHARITLYALLESFSHNTTLTGAMNLEGAKQLKCMQEKIHYLVADEQTVIYI
ncbi:hypothetical protein GQX74_007544 [Glossina fuscipes]|nr:hypothetical protein GQX74_007544 [Glossina fuscipes]